MARTSEVKSKKPLLEVFELHKTYQGPVSDLHVLQDVSLVLHHGEFLVVVGESGSGKSTLLQVLGTLDLPDSGQAILQGVRLFDLSDNERAHLRNTTIGFVYQEHHLIPELNAVENVMLPLLIGGVSMAESRQRSEDLLTRLHLKERLLHVPGRLSGGEAQRVAVARALVGKPALLLVDEPTGNLDEGTAKIVFQTMQGLCKEEGTAVMMVTHSMALAAEADRTLRLNGGKLLDVVIAH